MIWFSRRHRKYYAKCALVALPFAIMAAYLDKYGYRVAAMCLVIAATALTILLLDAP